MSGLDAEKVNAEYFPDGGWQVDFICNRRHRVAGKLFPRNLRLNFDEACRIL